MRKLWSNSRERTQGNEKRKGEESSYNLKVLKSCWGKRLEGVIQTQRKSTIPWLTPQDYDIRESGRVLELRNRDLWIRPTDLSWHFPILVTIRELPFRNHRGRSPAKWKAREDKIEEAKKQKTPKSEDQEWNSGRWKSSSWTWTSSSSSSAWREWSSDQTRERSDWQLTDWGQLRWARRATAWQSATIFSSFLTLVFGYDVSDCHRPFQPCV